MKYSANFCEQVWKPSHNAVFAKHVVNGTQVGVIVIEPNERPMAIFFNGSTEILNETPNLGYTVYRDEHLPGFSYD